MSWFWFSVITLLCWSGSDFFSKIGCRDSRDKYSQFKMVHILKKRLPDG